MQLVEAGKLLAPAVEDTISAVASEPRLAGAAQLARRYAEAIDTADDHPQALRELGPRLLDALAAIGATKTAAKAVTAANAPGRLTQLRAAHGA
jgi:hypothetical protein